MRVIIACEESQAVTKEFRKLGHEAFSCDILPCSGGHPEWHFQEDIFEVLKREDKFDLMIAHPPCTYLAVSGAGWMWNKDGTRNEDRYKNQMEGLEFVHALMDVDIDHICIENPISVISSFIREPDQIIQPWMFGDEAQKSTCLWLKNLPLLRETKIVGKGEMKEWIDTKTGRKKQQPMWYYEALSKARSPQERRTLRSKTFQGIAEAMAAQWSDLSKIGIQQKLF
jgi:site-specific DNA-cytosine methylase